MADQKHTCKGGGVEKITIVILSYHKNCKIYLTKLLFPSSSVVNFVLTPTKIYFWIDKEIFEKFGLHWGDFSQMGNEKNSQSWYDVVINIVNKIYLTKLLFPSSSGIKK